MLTVVRGIRPVFIYARSRPLTHHISSALSPRPHPHTAGIQTKQKTTLALASLSLIYNWRLSLSRARSLARSLTGKNKTISRQTPRSALNNEVEARAAAWRARCERRRLCARAPHRIFARQSHLDPWRMEHLECSRQPHTQGRSPERAMKHPADPSGPGDRDQALREQKSPDPWALCFLSFFTLSHEKRCTDCGCGDYMIT